MELVEIAALGFGAWGILVGLIALIALIALITLRLKPHHMGCV